MPNRCTWIDNVEFEPLEGGTMHFTFVSGDEEMRFCMSRSTVRKAAGKATRMLDAADREQQVHLFEVRAG